MQIVKFNLLTNNQTQYRSFLFAFQWFLLEMSQADGMQYLFNFVMFWSECVTLYINILVFSQKLTKVIQTMSNVSP